MNMMKGFCWRLLVCVPVALGLAALPAACEPEAAYPKSGGAAQEAAVLMVKKQADADAAAVELAKVYADMNDEERMRGGGV